MSTCEPNCMGCMQLIEMTGEGEGKGEQVEVVEQVATNDQVGMGEPAPCCVSTGEPN